MPKPWVRIANNTIDIILDQSWGAQPFHCQISIMKCLNLSGMVSPHFVRLESPYDILTVCEMRGIVSIMLIIDRRVIPRRCKANLEAEWKFYHDKVLDHCKIERKVDREIVGNPRPIYS